MSSSISRLDVDLLMRRTGWAAWLAVLLLSAAAALQWAGTAHIDRSIAVNSEELNRLRLLADKPRGPAVPAKSLNEDRLDAFAAQLGARKDANRFVANVFAQAKAHEIALTQAEYKFDFDKAGGFHTYQVTLPVRGAYPQVRKFIDATLQAVPCAALNDVDFKRDGIGAPATEAKLRFVFYLKDAKS